MTQIRGTKTPLGLETNPGGDPFRGSNIGSVPSETPLGRWHAAWVYGSVAFGPRRVRVR